ncbi:hypothetical protein XELAEV_18008010mg [Xenopus laevis]|uniref:Uncharacterized protein n=1 Tax=Xenopus laevis TaxID=8355 RepID=A0A974E2F0_XENLA|nr:hypothetical protein XELAEV_18008010mg [Xenopus laevis]
MISRKRIQPCITDTDISVNVWGVRKHGAIRLSVYSISFFTFMLKCHTFSRCLFALIMLNIRTIPGWNYVLKDACNYY